MDIDIIFRIAGVGVLIAVLVLVLDQAGRKEQAMLVSLSGLVVVLFWVVQYIGELFETIKTIFNL
jgi:stage III sporulation protein AC